MTRKKVQIALACCLTAAVFPTWSADQSNRELELELKGITLKFLQERRACPAKHGMERDFCLRHAEGREAAEKAEVRLRFQPSDEHRFHSDMARLEAHHAGERRRCYGLAPTDREPCMNQARDAYMLGKADTLISHRRMEPGWGQGGPGGYGVEQGRGIPPHRRSQPPGCMHPDPHHPGGCIRQQDRDQGR